ncbi:heme-binding protein [Pseudomonas sp. JQ170]|uniref:GlcG/HbpS family heme-binding protein n=1 Tax=unclassified Pseudomonas TaxID=196821 RepID=UPI002655A24E|nr:MULTISPECIES: heme-binding protein [unclassified Pseudomonas]MDN7141491.1 heme-binding protein [Pseudomonas sp. JQ170]WRO75606.1 heme-binding protein [Pseudomonas sp. 170C]
MKTARKLAALTAVIAPLILAGPAQAEAPSITSQMAQTMVDAAARAAQAKGFSIVISIVDNHGNLKHFHRMDNTSVGSIQVSQLKASTSAQFPVSTKVLAERSAGLPANPYASIPGFLLLEGGLPIMSKSGTHIGGIGISGATPELDGQFAQAAIDQLNQ